MKKTIYIALAVIALASCTKSEPASVEDGNELKFNVSFPGTGTKAAATAFESGDAISVYAVERASDGSQLPLQVGGNWLNNEKVTFDGGQWTPARTLYWNEQPCDFYGIYPYQPNITSIEAFPFTVATDQTGDGYEASDLLYAFAENVSRTDGSVNLKFRHIMSKLIVNVVKGPKFEGEIPDDVVAHIYNTNMWNAVRTS